MKPVTPLYLVAAITVGSAAVAASAFTTSETKVTAKETEIEMVVEKAIKGTKGSLLASCAALKANQSSEQASSCRYYIYGFVDAGQVTEAINSEHIRENDNPRSSFTERAYRTRVGQLDERVKTKEPLLKPFCVPEKESRERVIGKLAKHLPHSMDTGKMLSISVYKGLKTEYPCD
jgi:hypothetical protein